RRVHRRRGRARRSDGSTLMDAPPRRRQRFMAGCMVGGPALLFAGNALHPVNHKTDEAAWLAGIAAHRSQWYAAHLIIFLGVPLFVGAVVGLLRLVRGPGAGWAEAGAVLAVFGLFATEGFVTV